MLFTSEVITKVYTPRQFVSVIELHGEVTALSEHKLTDAYYHASNVGSRTIILSFKGLKYMNSSGIGLLIMLLVRANRLGQKLVVSDLNEHYQMVFELTKLNEAIPIYESVEEALRDFNPATIQNPDPRTHQLL